MIKKLLLIIFSILAANILHAQQNKNWTSPTAMKFPVSGAQGAYDVVSQGNKIYILGGYSETEQKQVDWIQEYDAFLNTWNLVGTMKQPRVSFTAGIWKNFIILFGGVSESSLDKKSIERWDFKVKPAISEAFDQNDNFGRAFSSGHILGDSLYVIGGNAVAGVTAKMPYLIGYNLSTRQITFEDQEVTSLSKPQDQMTFIAEDYIYIFGGSSSSGVLNSIRKFNIKTKKFEPVKETLLEVRAGGAAVYNPISKKGYIIGGYNETEKALSSVEQITIKSDGTLKISRFASLNYARKYPVVVNFKGTVAVFGGKDVNEKVVKDVEILTDTNYYPTSAEEILPLSFGLDQNYPNPFNPATVINYKTSNAGFVTLTIFDVLGRTIETIVKQYQNPGEYQFSFDASKAKLTSGVYFYQIKLVTPTKVFSQSKKMVLAK